MVYLLLMLTGCLVMLSIISCFDFLYEPKFKKAVETLIFVALTLICAFKVVRCPQCGTLEVKTKYCTECGYELEDDEYICVCGKHLPHIDNYCPDCGSPKEAK